MTVISNSLAAETTFKICHEFNDYPPYIYQEEGRSQGILADIVIRAGKDADLSVDLYSKPWKRCQQDVQSGKAQALFGMIKTDDRMKTFAFPPEQGLSSWHIWLAQYPVFTPKGVPFMPKHYQAKTGIGAPLGYVVADLLAQKGWLSPFQNSPEDGLWMVGMNKLDGYAVERLIGTSLLARNNLLNKVEVSDYIVLQTQWHVAFNKSFYKANPTLVHNFWHQVGEHRQIIESEYSK